MYLRNASSWSGSGHGKHCAATALDSRDSVKRSRAAPIEALMSCPRRCYNYCYNKLSIGARRPRTKMNSHLESKNSNHPVFVMSRKTRKKNVNTGRSLSPCRLGGVAKVYARRICTKCSFSFEWQAISEVLFKGSRLYVEGFLFTQSSKPSQKRPWRFQVSNTEAAEVEEIGNCSLISRASRQETAQNWFTLNSDDPRWRTSSTDQKVRWDQAYTHAW